MNYKLILVIALILLLSGCSSNTDNYYRSKAIVEGYELDVEVLERNVVRYFHLMGIRD
jgi:outer membrane protein assembly factor BamE (lipoprotein component of BamABCDE complex)